MELDAVAQEFELKCLMEDPVVAVVAEAAAVVEEEGSPDIPGQHRCCCFLPPTETYPFPGHTSHLTSTHPTTATTSTIGGDVPQLYNEARQLASCPLQLNNIKLKIFNNSFQFNMQLSPTKFATKQLYFLLHKSTT